MYNTVKRACIEILKMKNFKLINIRNDLLVKKTLQTKDFLAKTKYSHNIS